MNNLRDVFVYDSGWFTRSPEATRSIRGWGNRVLESVTTDDWRRGFDRVKKRECRSVVEEERGLWWWWWWWSKAKPPELVPGDPSYWSIRVERGARRGGVAHTQHPFERIPVGCKPPDGSSLVSMTSADDATQSGNVEKGVREKEKKEAVILSFSLSPTWPLGWRHSRNIYSIDRRKATAHTDTNEERLRRRATPVGVER